MKLARIFMLVEIPDDADATFDGILRHVADLPNPGQRAPESAAALAADRATVTDLMQQLALGHWPMMLDARARGRSLVASVAVQRLNEANEWENIPHDELTPKAPSEEAPR